MDSGRSIFEPPQAGGLLDSIQHSNDVMNRFAKRVGITDSVMNSLAGSDLMSTIQGGLIGSQFAEAQRRHEESMRQMNEKMTRLAKVEHPSVKTNKLLLELQSVLERSEEHHRTQGETLLATVAIQSAQIEQLKVANGSLTTMVQKAEKSSNDTKWRWWLTTAIAVIALVVAIRNGLVKQEPLSAPTTSTETKTTVKALETQRPFKAESKPPATKSTDKKRAGG